MPESKSPWYVTLASYASYAIVLAFGGAVGFWAGKDEGRHEAQREAQRNADRNEQLREEALAAHKNRVVKFAENELVAVGSSSGSLKVFRLDEALTLDVSVEELQGRNIEFSATQDGNRIFTSGAHKGKATGQFRALPGLCTINIVNGNLLDGKSVALTVKGKPIE